MRSIKTGAVLFAAMLLCSSPKSRAAEIGITEPGTDEYPNGGLRLMTELPNLLAKFSAVDIERREFYSPRVGGDQTEEFRRVDLDSGDWDTAIRRMPRLLGPFHILFEPDDEFDTVIGNARNSTDVIACRVDFDGSRLSRFDVISSTGMQFAATLFDSAEFLLLDQSSPINVLLFDRETMTTVDTLELPPDASSLVGAMYHDGLGKLFVLTTNGDTHLSIVDMQARETSAHVNLSSVIAAPAPVIIADDAGDSLWLFDMVASGIPARAIRLNADTFAVEESRDLDVGDTSVLSGFLSADESLLVVHATSRIITLNPETLEIQEGITAASLAPMQPHASRSKAMVRRTPPSSTAVDIMSLSPLEVVSTPPHVVLPSWIPTQLVEDPGRDRTILIGERLSPTPSREPRAAVLSHDPSEVTSLVTISPGVFSQRSALDAGRDLLVSIDTTHTTTTEWGQLTVLDRESGKTRVAYSDQMNTFRSIVIDADTGTFFAAGNTDPFLFRFDTESLAILASTPPPVATEYAIGVALDSLSRTLYVTSSNGKLHSYNADTLTHIDSLELPAHSDFVVLDQARSLAYVGTSINGPTGFVYEIDLDSLEIARDLALPSTNLRPIAMGVDPVRRVGWVGTQNPTRRLGAVDLENMLWRGSIGYGALNSTATFDLDPDFGRVIAVSTLPSRNPAVISLAQQGYIKGTRISIPANADVSSVHLFAHDDQGNLRAAIYAEGSEKTLLWQSGVVAVSVQEEFLAIPIAEGSPSALSLPAGDYWLAWQVDNVEQVMSYAGESEGDGFLSVQDFGEFPSALEAGDVTSTGEQWAGYITADLAPLLGDINGDGIVNVADVTELALMLSEVIPDVPDLETADMNDDGVVDEADLRLLAEMIVE